MDKISKSESVINKLYDKLSFFDVYGGSVFFCLVLLVVPLVICVYCYIMKNTYPIKNDWVAQRCHPYVIPFAGMINKPDDKTAFEFTEENLAFCVQNILTSVTGYLVEPITFITSSLSELYNELANMLQDLRNILANIRSYVNDMAKEILGRIANIMVPLQNILIKFKDAMGKMKGILATSLYTAMGAFYAFKSLIGAIVQVVILLLIIAAGMIIALWIVGFFFFPSAILAAVSTVLFALILAFCVPIIVFMKDHLHIQPGKSLPGLPAKPSCFDKNTLLKMNDHTYKKISDIEAGDILFNNDRVTAKMKLDSTNTKMFHINEIIVSGCHRIMYEGHWKYVCDVSASELVNNYSEPFIYCLNTESKRILINNSEFCDWDEIFEKEAVELLDLVNKDACETEYIHKYFDNGFVNTTPVELENGTIKQIQDICVSDILKDNVKIYGLVEIYAEDLNKLTLGENKKETKFPRSKLFHLLTDTDYFIVNNEKYHDYNSCIEQFLFTNSEKYFV